MLQFAGAVQAVVKGPSIVGEPARLVWAGADGREVVEAELAKVEGAMVEEEDGWGPDDDRPEEELETVEVPDPEDRVVADITTALRSRRGRRKTEPCSGGERGDDDSSGGVKGQRHDR